MFQVNIESIDESRWLDQSIGTELFPISDLLKVTQCNDLLNRFDYHQTVCVQDLSIDVHIFHRMTRTWHQMNMTNPNRTFFASFSFVTRCGVSVCFSLSLSLSLSLSHAYTRIGCQSLSLSAALFLRFIRSHGHTPTTTFPTTAL